MRLHRIPITSEEVTSSLFGFFKEYQEKNSILLNLKLVSNELKVF